MTWEWFLDHILPYLIHGMVDALVWRLVVVEGRLSRVTLEGEKPVDIEPEPGLELENTVRALEQRMAELEEMLE